MTDLVSLFRNFIYRDLAFILGGSIVIAATLYVLRSCGVISALGINLHNLLEQPYILVLLAVLAYVVGYTVQDFGAILVGLTFTGYVLKPRCFWQSLYHSFTDATWKETSFTSFEDVHEFALRMMIWASLVGWLEDAIWRKASRKGQPPSRHHHTITTEKGWGMD